MNRTVRRVLAAGVATMFILDGVAAMVVLDLVPLPAVVALHDGMTTRPAPAKIAADVEAQLGPTASDERVR